MGSMADKLARVKKAEDEAAETLEDYRRRAEAVISEAREKAAKARAEAEARARSEGEAEMKRIIEEAEEDARGLRERYGQDAAALREAVASRQEAAVRFIVERLEEGG
ncbi:MAG: hypothetical protein H5T74_01410 [Actinobacteria bacterium]|nr:hypothetical protein [Actinomycetota bacterium]